MSPSPKSQRRVWSLAIGRRASQQCWGVTAGKARHNSSNVRGVTTGKVGRSSSDPNHNIIFIRQRSDRKTCNTMNGDDWNRDTWRRDEHVNYNEKINVGYNNTRTHTHKQIIYTRIHIYTNICLHAHTHTRTHARPYTAIGTNVSS